MIDPPPLSFIAWITARQPRKTPSLLISCTNFHSSRLIFSMSCGAPVPMTPALFIKMSSFPCISSVSRDDTLPIVFRYDIMRHRARGISDLLCDGLCAVRVLIREDDFRPFPREYLAARRSEPDAPPVINAILPSNRAILLPSLYSSSGSGGNCNSRTLAPSIPPVISKAGSSEPR